MKKAIKISAIVLSAGLAVGCATNSDIEGLQSQVDSLKTQVTQASADAAAAKTAANAANAAAARAASAAESAGSYAQETNSKLDRMFKKSMMK